MAKIILSPDEQFEHIHGVESRSTLVEGEIEFTVGKKSVKMRRGETISIPANELHCMRNVGKTNAVIDCLHRPSTGG